MVLILVTGGSGLVGNGIRKISKNYNYNFIFWSSKDCNLLNYEETYEKMKEICPDYVIHLAANVGGLFKNMNHKVEMLEDNLKINFNVIKACHYIKVKKLISCLSTCIFPDKTTYPINEDMLFNGPPHFSNDAYAYAKRLIEIQSKAYREQYNDDFTCVIPTNIYGPFDNFNLEDAHVVPALIHKCYLAKQKGEKFVVAGTGKPLRQFIHSEDLGDLIMQVIEKYSDKMPIILSPDEESEISIGDIARLIAKKFDYLEYLEFDTKKADGQYKKTASNKKLKELLPNYKFKDFETGIDETIDWFIQNYNSCRK
jgi:GDP-L-fucose synthase